MEIVKTHTERIFKSVIASKYIFKRCSLSVLVESVDEETWSRSEFVSRRHLKSMARVWYLRAGNHRGLYY